MIRRMFAILLPALLLAVLCVQSGAQLSPYPTSDASVRGWGAIPVRTDAVGVFDINVSRSGANLYGGLKFTESVNTGTRGHAIVSTRILELTAAGNTATVKAEGYWNNMPAWITVEVLDDNFSGDWFHVTAVPKGPLTILYDAAGGLLKGDVSVYVKPAKEYYAKGFGYITANTNIARFQFSAEQRGGVVSGSAHYLAYPVNSTGAARLPINIYLPKLSYFTVEGNTALLGGMGTFNGRPAKIDIRALDNSRLMIPVIRPDEFYITASPTANDIRPVEYEGGGPLRMGDITIVVQ